MDSAGNNSRSSDIVRPNFENVRPISHYDRTWWPNMSPAHLEFSSSKVLSVNKLCPVQFFKCPTKRKIWKDICPLNKEKLFPALVDLWTKYTLMKLNNGKSIGYTGGGILKATSNGLRQQSIARRAEIKVSCIYLKYMVIWHDWVSCLHARNEIGRGSHL